MRTLKEEEVNGKTYALARRRPAHIGAFLENVYNRATALSRSATNPRSTLKPNSPP